MSENVIRRQRHIRGVAIFLAMIWLGAGLAAVSLGIANRRWLFVVVGTAALWYGALWIRVAQWKRTLTTNEAFRPWRRS
jgi:hypothetical protein